MQQWPQDWKRSVFIPIPKKNNAKECSNYCTIALISHASKVMLKILQAKDKVSICAWIYLWAFYFIPLINISVFVPVPYCLDNCGFVIEPEVSWLIPPVPFFFLKIALAIRGFLYFHTKYLLKNFFWLHVVFL